MKTAIAIAQLSVFGLVTLGGILEVGSDTFYSIMGLGMIITAIWLPILVLKARQGTHRKVISIIQLSAIGVSLVGAFEFLDYYSEGELLYIGIFVLMVTMVYLPVLALKK